MISVKAETSEWLFGNTSHVIAISGCDKHDFTDRNTVERCYNAFKGLSHFVSHIVRLLH